MTRPGVWCLTVNDVKSMNGKADYTLRLAANSICCRICSNQSHRGSRKVSGCVAGFGAPRHVRDLRLRAAPSLRGSAAPLPCAGVPSLRAVQVIAKSLDTLAFPRVSLPLSRRGGHHIPSAAPLDARGEQPTEERVRHQSICTRKSTRSEETCEISFEERLVARLRIARTSLLVFFMGIARPPLRTTREVFFRPHGLLVEPGTKEV